MKVRIVLSLAAIIADLASARSTINYNDVVAKGYRWVTVDGPYACVSKDDLRQIIKSRNTGTELEMIKQQRAYYLLQGDIVKVVREDVTSGLALIRMAGIPKELWTQTKFLSKRPVENAFGVVETPETSGLILSGLTSITDSAEPSGATPAPSTKQTPAKTLEISPKPNFAKAFAFAKANKQEPIASVRTRGSQHPASFHPTTAQQRCEFSSPSQLCLIPNRSYLRPKATGRMAFSAALVLNSRIG
jgi:hypothetical protein